MRRRRPTDESLEGTRRSRTFYPVSDPSIAAKMQAVSSQGYYTYLLHQDIKTVIPYDFGRGDGPSARVIGPDRDRVQRLIAAAISVRDHSYSLTESLRQFVSSTAENLVFDGTVTYEIDYLPPAGTTAERPTSFRLDLVAPGTTGSHKGRPIRYVPTAFDGQQDETGLHYVELDPATLVIFRLDPNLEEPVRKMIAFLRAVDGQQCAKAALMEQSVTGRSSYNFAKHQRKRSELFAEATRSVGWNVRGLFKESHLEPYEVWRQIRFLEFKIRVRDSIIDRLNAALAEIGQRIGFEVSIELSGLPTLQDVESAKEDLKLGRRGLSDLAVFAI